VICKVLAVSADDADIQRPAQIQFGSRMPFQRLPLSSLIGMRIHRPSWCEPLDTVGEWVGFLGGLIVATAVVAFLVLVVKGFVNSVTMSVRNDSHLTVTINACNDGTEFIEPGGVFRVQGIAEHDQFDCLVSYYEGQEQCMVIPHARSIRGTIDLSQLIRVSRSRCD
jgi:hypothetical protein